MIVVAAVAGVLFGVAHAAAGIGVLAAPSAPRGSGSHGAVPVAVRYMWVALALLAAVGGVLFAATAAPASLALMAVGMLGLLPLAVTNGVLMYGRPTWSHHLVRSAIALAVLGVAVAAL